MESKNINEIKDFRKEFTFNDEDVKKFAKDNPSLCPNCNKVCKESDLQRECPKLYCDVCCDKKC